MIYSKIMKKWQVSKLTKIMKKMISKQNFK